MQFCCSQYLLKKAQQQPELIEKPEIFSWSVTGHEIGQHLRLTVCNDATRLAFVLDNLPVSEYRNLTQILEAGIHHVLTMIGLSEQMIANYFRNAGEFVYTKSRGPVYMGRVGHVIQATNQAAELLTNSTIFQQELSLYINQLPTKIGESQVIPAQEMVSVVKQTIDTPITLEPIEVQETIVSPERAAFDILIRLNFGEMFAVRRLLVPQDFTFSKLHTLIQIAFNWENRHPYAFDGSFQNKPVRILATELQKFVPQLEEEVYLLTAEKTKLADIFIPGSEFEYVYDFGDAWQHDIIVRGFTAINTPICLLASGGCPPEDIGGPDGYGFLHEMLEHIELLPPEEQMQLRLLAPQLELEEPNIVYINEQLKRIK